MPHETWLKAQAVIPRLPELRHSVRDLDERVKKVEEAMRTAQPAKAKKKPRSR
jgi:UDP-3-O-[3-hydroxymyristoyl] glucosamine N-acyltransferase